VILKKNQETTSLRYMSGRKRKKVEEKKVKCRMRGESQKHRKRVVVAFSS